ncbi:MAG: DinB family protein [Blastocatellia bacterium]
MRRPHPLIEENVHILRQGVALIEQIGDAVYANAKPPMMESGVGGHLRHCIDFYQRFLSSFRTGRINYVLRQRNPMLETSRRLAISEIEAIIERLSQLSPDDLQSNVQVIAEDLTGPLDASAWSRSSVGRELQLLLGHTIHHYAMIALALRLQGVEPSAEFGVAPSTLAYWRRTA